MSSQPTNSFSIRGTKFLLNGEPFRIFSGELHYFRVPREYWRDRLLKLRAMGLNTICTYMPWNLHEPRPGQFDFSGMLDIAAFVRLAHELGLWVLLRPGPYICAEWDFGGLPAWLLANERLRVRCDDPPYIEAMTRYIERVGEELSPLACTRGGPILMVQVENEYGSYGNDKTYLRKLRDLLGQVGFDVPLFTSDGSDPDMLAAGTIEDCLAVVNFGSNAPEHIGRLRAFRSDQPAMCGEFWCGWFDAWGKRRQGSASTDSAKDVKWMLENDASFNLYMFHGGTNFGMTSGANHHGTYEPQVTSYDYWAPLDEAGRPQPKYFAYRELLAAHQPKGVVLPDVPPAMKVIEIPEIRLAESAALFEQLPVPIESASPQNMEALGQNSGLILYRTSIAGLESRTLEIFEPHDYAIVYLDGKYIATLDRRLNQTKVELPTDLRVAANASSREAAHNPAGSRPRLHERKLHQLDILVDTTGRVNYGPRMHDRKGITDRVVLGRITLMDWQIFALPLDGPQRAALKFTSDAVDGPAFHRGTFELTETGDTFLDLRGWRKGAVWINGHNLGRFWHIGPQQTLYCPGVWLKEGANELVVFDVERSGGSIRGLNEPVLNECAGSD
jgi:beta-galactosidase